MKLLENITLVFFDLDGLLVNTEHLHYMAYQNMCQARGVCLDWSFEKYCSIAHKSAEGLQKVIQQEIRSFQQVPWSILYQEKKEAYLSLLDKGAVELMEGVKETLLWLNNRNIPSCVVTNSGSELVVKIRKCVTTLDSITHWVVREDYPLAKPAPDGYLLAKQKYARSQDKIIGFEDTWRGWSSLDAAGVEGVVISSQLEREVKKRLLENGAQVFSSFRELL